jgi:glycosyltransferase involved in cell wall biosynthesis
VSLRVLDPSGATHEWIRVHFPDAQIDRIPDGEQPYDAAMLFGDFDNQTDPALRLAALLPHVAKPYGRIYVSVPEGTASGRMGVRTPGRRRTWRSVDVADVMRRYGELLEFGVDEDGYISGVIAPENKREEIAIWTGYAIGPWDPMDIVNRGLGGSETAAYRLAEHFALMGHVVTLYGHFHQEGAIKDVILKDWRHFDPTTPRKALITFRDASMYDVPVNAQTKILWLEDVAGAEGLTEERAKRLDYVCGVSNWHRENILDVHPYLPPEKAIASRNAITHSYFEDEDPERERRLLYTSSPDRGLHIALECWPEIKRRVPDAAFYHTYGPWYDICADGRQDAAVYRERCRRMTAEYEDVKAVGPLGQKDLAMLMRSSMVWCHPSWFMEYGEFNETCCISVMEAQAAGCYPVTSDRGALAENNKIGVQIPGDPMTPEWRERFIDEIVRGLTDPDLRQMAEVEGPIVTENWDWWGVCKQLEALWLRPEPEMNEDGVILAPAI